MMLHNLSSLLGRSFHCSGDVHRYRRQLSARLASLGEAA